MDFGTGSNLHANWNIPPETGRKPSNTPFPLLNFNFIPPPPPPYYSGLAPFTDIFLHFYRILKKIPHKIAVYMSTLRLLLIMSTKAAKVTIGLLPLAVLAMISVACSPDNSGGGNNSRTQTISGVAVPFRYVPAGSFQRDGAAENVSVISKGYWMAETETTQELFVAVMGTNPSNFSDTPETGEVQNRRPVEQVNWYEAIAFCNKLSLADNKQAVYSVKAGGTEISWASLTYDDIPTTANDDWNAVTMDVSKNGYRLPTEMEWMWAAMGANKARQPNTTGWSKTYAGSNSIGDCAWYSGYSNNKTHEVGKKTANEIGLQDMSGNVYEWCWDRYGGIYGNSGTVADTGTLTDYTGAVSGLYRVIRGGSWINSASGCALAYRNYHGPTRRYYGIGFRIVCP
jgi:formylglycine-generating enzyme required for sulfatase activity